MNSIYYLFCGNKFSSVVIQFQDENNFDKLKRGLRVRHGIPSKSDSERYCWLGNHVLIKLGYDQYTEKGSIIYLYLPALDDF